jgi:hypothetical protein
VHARLDLSLSCLFYPHFPRCGRDHKPYGLFTLIVWFFCIPLTTWAPCTAVDDKQISSPTSLDIDESTTHAANLVVSACLSPLSTFRVSPASASHLFGYLSAICVCLLPTPPPPPNTPTPLPRPPPISHVPSTTPFSPQNTMSNFKPVPGLGFSAYPYPMANAFHPTLPHPPCNPITLNHTPPPPVFVSTPS